MIISFHLFTIPLQIYNNNTVGVQDQLGRVKRSPKEARKAYRRGPIDGGQLGFPLTCYESHLFFLSLYHVLSHPLLYSIVLNTQKGFDVFNALDLMENKTFLEKLKFGIGDGNLQYYLYNWKCPSMGSDKVYLY